MSADAAECGPDSVLSIPLTVSIRRFRGVLTLAGGNASVELDEVGAQIYKRLDGRRSVRDVAREVASVYGVEESDVLADVIELSRQLLGWGLASHAVDHGRGAHDD